jgi:hypothetical protein
MSRKKAKQLYLLFLAPELASIAVLIKVLIALVSTSFLHQFLFGLGVFSRYVASM